MEENGEKLGLVVSVLWDPIRQDVALQFDNAEFKTWNFLAAILDMARKKAEHQERIAQMAIMQEQMKAQVIAQQIQKSLKH